MPVKIEMPRLSDTMQAGTVVKWNVKEGDKVKSGQALADIETDKATMELPCYDDGVVAAFAKPDFDLTREPFAEAPIVEIAAAFARDAFRLLVPILKPPQCEALGRVVDEALDEADRKRAARRGEGGASR